MSGTFRALCGLWFTLVPGRGWSQALGARRLGPGPTSAVTITACLSDGHSLSLGLKALN